MKKKNEYFSITKKKEKFLPFKQEHAIKFQMGFGKKTNFYSSRV
jgi:hypothetical protein